MSEKLLFVDDDENILSGFQRSLRKQYALDIAPGGAKGLDLIQQQGPYAVVVSDMRMPEMNGVQFLARVRQLAPDCVRIMLTGQADMQDAILAVNEGNIFRFLTKPCDLALLSKALDAGLQQYRLINAERELLEKTLNGSIQLLMDVLSLSNPEAFSRAERLKRTMGQLCQSLELPDLWQYELAAMLSQLGCVILPKDLLKKYQDGYLLSPEDQNLLDSLPAVAHDLLCHIPRLESVAQIIAWQNEPLKSLSGHLPPKERKPTELGAQMLKLALRFDEMVFREKISESQTRLQLLESPEEFDPKLAELLKPTGSQDKPLTKMEIDVFELGVDMIIARNISTKKGVFLVGEGQQVTSTLIKFLNNYVNRGEIEEKVLVLAAR